MTGIIADMPDTTDNSLDSRTDQEQLIQGVERAQGLDIETPILTRRGWVPMGEVHVGDYVYHPRGHLTRVVAMSRVIPGRPCYRVTTTDGRCVVTHAEHLWAVVDKRRSTSRGPRGGTLRSFVPRVLTTRQLLDAGLSRYACGGRTSVADGKAYATNEYRFVLPQQEPLVGSRVDLPVEPYLLGAWLGDGHTAAATLTCSVKDEPYWRTAIATAGFTPTSQCSRPGVAQIGMTSPGPGRQNRSLNVQLRRLGVLGSKHVPDLYLLGAPEQREAVLQGLLDTDGTIEPVRGQIEFCSTLRPLADAVLFLARSLGWRATLRTGRATLYGRDVSEKYRVMWTPKTSDPFAPFRIPRKAGRVRDVDGGRGRSTLSIARVEPVDARPVRCLKVASLDGLFLVGTDLIPTEASNF